jgi:hypothetical protein
MTWLIRLKAYAIAALGLLAAVATAALYWRNQGKAAQKATDDARQAQADAQAAQQVIKANEVRHEVEVETARLPDAPPQKVADADPASAAGKLRDDGWVR